MIQFDVDLSTLNTLQLRARAVQFARIEQAAQIIPTLHAAGHTTRRLILGGGSNLVLTGDFNGLVLQMAIAGRALTGEDSDAWYVTAGAGENWHDFVLWTLAQGWPGLENLALIPGTVGAAPIQNIGAYGVEAGDFLHEVVATHPDSGSVRRFSQTECALGYRDSLWKKQGWHRSGESVITKVTFRLPKRWQAVTRYADVAAALEAQKLAMPTAQEMATIVIGIRRQKLPDPALLPNAGSFFQNPVVDIITAAKLGAHYPDMPRYRAEKSANDAAKGGERVKLAAGWMIEQAGWKGRSLGPVGMYEKQALVMVNHEPGTARGTDVGMLAEAIRSDVKRKFGVGLIPEPIFV